MKVISVFVVLIFLCSGVFAISGVSLASYDVYFNAGYGEELLFL